MGLISRVSSRTYRYSTHILRLVFFKMERETEDTCNFEGCPLTKRFLNLKNSPAIGFFTAIQNEQVELVRHCIESHRSICQATTTDEFNWTALKTAEQTKNQEILILLKSTLTKTHYAKNEPQNSQETITISDSEESNPDSPNTQNTSNTQNTPNEPLSDPEIIDLEKIPYCSACNRTVECMQLHILTISHRLNYNKNISPPKPDFWITPNSIGYKMLKNQGWNEKQGSLREGSRLYPVESVIKNTRLAGFGSKNDLEKRVTHFRRGASERIKLVKVQREATISKHGVFRRRSTGGSSLVGLNQRQLRMMMQDF